jgi:outer membrane usher protein FimD/PapC
MSRTGGYRLYLTDKLSYEQELYTGIEHGPEGNTYPVDYASVAYYNSENQPADIMEPSDGLRTVYIPKEHVYYPQLMDITTGENVAVTYHRGLRMVTSSEGMVRIMLNDIPEGTYDVSFSYYEKPNGADFCVYQRQKQLTGWKETKAPKEELKHKQSLGEVVITPQTNSISVHVRKNELADEFELEQIHLERKDPLTELIR